MLAISIGLGATAAMVSAVFIAAANEQIHLLITMDDAREERGE